LGLSYSRRFFADGEQTTWEMTPMTNVCNL
jgi:hypothetical protein